VNYKISKSAAYKYASRKSYCVEELCYLLGGLFYVVLVAAICW
jgi:hypothetical protein